MTPPSAASSVYPLDESWLANPAITPRIRGYETLKEGIAAASVKLAESGSAAIAYSCLSSFTVEISSADGARHLVKVAVGSRPKTAVVVGLANCRTEEVQRSLDLLDDDARAICFLLRRVGESLNQKVAR